MPPKNNLPLLPSQFEYVKLKIGRLGGAEYEVWLPNNSMMPGGNDVMTDIMLAAAETQVPDHN